MKGEIPIISNNFSSILINSYNLIIMLAASTNVYSVKTPDASATIKLNARKNSRPRLGDVAAVGFSGVKWEYAWPGVFQFHLLESPLT